MKQYEGQISAPMSLSASRRAKPVAKTGSQRARELIARVKASGGKKISAILPKMSVEQLNIVRKRGEFACDTDVIIAALDNLAKTYEY